MGGIEVNDRVISLLDHYDIQILRTRKGRGAILCDTEKGCLIFKEYTESPGRVCIQNKILETLSNKIDFPVEAILKSKEDGLLTEDQDGKKYILKTFFESRECNINDEEECREAVKCLAYLHNSMCLSPEDVQKYDLSAFSVQKEFDKHNRELKKVSRYLHEKSQKSLFENTLLQNYDYYLNQALEIAEEWKEFVCESDLEYIKQQGMFCHGDYQYHNIIKTGKSMAIINFERCILDNPARDLCLFMRKLLEKNNWSEKLGDSLLNTYNSIRPLSARSFVELYYRLYYPEKFWKIVNFYFNSRKSWIPEKNREKLQILFSQEKEKQIFLDSVFRTIH